MAIRAETSFSLADQLFNKATVKLLSDHIEQVLPEFRSRRFKLRASKAFPQLELKARISYLATELKAELPDDFHDAVAVLTKALPPPLDPTLGDDDFGAFIWSVLGEYVVHNGSYEAHVPASLNFLREQTKRFSAEFAIRPFLKHFQKQTLEFLGDCALDDNYHVRRLASEGSRPYLPWAERVVLPTGQILTLLDSLHADPTRFVTRSVANSLNDLSKIDPDAVIETLGRWQREEKQTDQELAWMTRHALRTLSKRGHTRALAHLGYPANPKIELRGFHCARVVTVGETLECSVTLRSREDARLKLTLSVGFLKASGQLSQKSFALKDLALGKGDTISLSKKISFKAMTTRTLYPGEHSIALFANGKILIEEQFELVS